MAPWDKPKTLIVFLRDYNGVYHIIKKLKINDVTKDKVEFKDGTYKLDQTLPAYANKKVTIYCFDIDKGFQLNFKKGATLDPKVMDLFISRNFVKDISSGLSPNTFTMEIKNLIIGGLIGAGFVGFILMIMIYMGVF